VSASPQLLTEVTVLAASLNTERGERGMVHGRRTSTPASRRSPVDLDALDAQREAQVTLRRWADRVCRAHVRHCWEDPSAPAVLRDHWDWAVAQPWGPAMVAELEALRARLANGGRPVRVIVCPVCSLPTRLDRLVVEHRSCLAQVPLEQ
jgi:hypothetical protein